MEKETVLAATRGGREGGWRSDEGSQKAQACSYKIYAERRKKLKKKPKFKRASAGPAQRQEVQTSRNPCLVLEVWPGPTGLFS